LNELSDYMEQNPCCKRAVTQISNSLNCGTCRSCHIHMSLLLGPASFLSFCKESNYKKCTCGSHRYYLNPVIHISLSNFTDQKCSGFHELKSDTVILQIPFCSIWGFLRDGYEEFGLLRCFAGTYCLHLEGWRVDQARNHQKQRAKQSWFLAWLDLWPRRQRWFVLQNHQYNFTI
jgi:hypothetical protein